MNLKKSYFYLYLISFLILTSCQQENNILVATSANMQFAMEELVAVYEKESNQKIDLVISSSGKLTAQIEQGAPYDIFVSANTVFPDYLYENGFSDNAPKVYAKGTLILWTLKDVDLSLEILKTDAIKKIAIANPKTAPYGKVTVDFLKKKGIYKDIEHKFVYGESISQVNQFISTQSVDVGFTAQAIKYTKSNPQPGVFLDLDAPAVSQSALLINHRELHENASEFYDFISSKKGKEILNRFGYKTN